MKKIIFIFTAAVSLFTSCSKDDNLMAQVPDTYSFVKITQTPTELHNLMVGSTDASKAFQDADGNFLADLRSSANITDGLEPGDFEKERSLINVQLCIDPQGTPAVSPTGGYVYVLVAVKSFSTLRAGAVVPVTSYGTRYSSQVDFITGEININPKKSTFYIIN